MKKETFTFFLITIGILGFSSIPYFLGQSTETDILLFRGTYADTADYAVHTSMMQAGRLGEWGYQMRFTTEEHTPAFIRLFYIFLGHISRWLNFDVETMFQIARWFFGFVALWSLKLLFQKLFKNTSLDYFPFFLAIFGGGIGWLQIILGAPLEPISPIDLWLIDAYILFSISLFPSFSFTLTLMVFALYLFLEYLHNQQWRNIVGISVLAVVSQLFNPIAFAVIDFAMVGAVVFTWWQNKKIEWKYFHDLVVISITQIPLLIYNLLILTRNPIWSQFTLQNETLSPSPSFYFWGFFPFWIFAFFGIVQSIKEKNSMMGAMSAWVISGFILAYLPVLIQRRFLLGITIPLGALAMYGLKTLLDKLAGHFSGIKKRQNLIFFSYSIFASISSIFLILNSSLYVSSRPPQLFYPNEIENAVEWLNKNASPNDFVLASQETSQILAQRTALKMYFGHEMETLHFDEKESTVKAFYENTVEDDWLSQTPIQWIVYGPYEVEINNQFIPSENFELVYENDSVKIYQTLK